MPGHGIGHWLLYHDISLLDALPQCEGAGADTGTSWGEGVVVGRYLTSRVFRVLFQTQSLVTRASTTIFLRIRIGMERRDGPDSAHNGK